jgi:ADP-ribosylglycohydrolase
LDTNNNTTAVACESHTAFTAGVLKRLLQEEEKKFEILKNKYIGCMLGAAIGDALGKQNEGVRRKEILKMGYIKDYGRAPTGSPGEKLRAGQYTDDTEQMLVLAQSFDRL